MKFISSSAPGKVILSGEYAVLQNAPAISMAIDRRAVVRLSPADSSSHRAITPGHAEGQWRFTADDVGQIHWLDEPPAGGLRLLEEAWRACSPQPSGGLLVVVDTVDFFDAESGGKLGLGGSAAAITALVGALCQLVPDHPPLSTVARQAHLALQNGAGSGVDVATSLHGGVIEFMTSKYDAPLRRQWPAGLHCRLLWSAMPADTTRQLRKLESAGLNAQHWAPLQAAASGSASAWAGTNVAAILGACARYTATLRQFSVDHKLGIFDAGHDELTELAASFEVVYKPCGAGGGDIGVVLAHDESTIDRYCTRAESHGFRPLPVTLDNYGVRISSGDGF